jgi:oligosaccharide repeat unit polymerase
MYILTVRKPRFLDPNSIFLIFNLINYLGTLPLLDYRYKSDTVHFYFLSIGLIVFIVGSVIGARIFPVTEALYLKWKQKPYVIEGGHIYKNLVYFIIFISILLSILYYYAVGYNIFLMGVMNLITGAGEIENASTLRLASYNSKVGGRYLFPGYINQLKNTLLPLLIAFIWVRSNTLKEKMPMLIKFASLLSIFFIFGTGQRGAFVLAGLMIGIFVLISSEERAKKKVLLYGGGALICLFFLSSFFIGRNSNKGNKTLTGNIQGLYESTQRRISTANQLGSVIGFRKIMYYQPTQWGGEWAKAFIGLAPGVDGSNLSGKIFSLLYGGNGVRGNAPPSSWASIYYNFGWFGILLIPIFISFFLKYLYFRFLSKPKSLFRNLIYVSSFVLIGTWIAGSPTYYFNVGLFTLILLYLMLKFLGKLFGRNLTIINHIQ